MLRRHVFEVVSYVQYAGTSSSSSSFPSFPSSSGFSFPSFLHASFIMQLNTSEIALMSYSESNVTWSFNNNLRCASTTRIFSEYGIEALNTADSIVARCFRIPDVKYRFNTTRAVSRNA